MCFWWLCSLPSWGRNAGITDVCCHSWHYGTIYLFICVYHHVQVGVRWQCVGIIYLLPVLLGLNSGHQAWQHVSHLFTEPLPGQSGFFTWGLALELKWTNLQGRHFSLTEPPRRPEYCWQLSQEYVRRCQCCNMTGSPLTSPGLWHSDKRKSDYFFFGHKIVGFDYKNSACTDGNVGERRVEFIALCLNYFLPRSCCFFISTTGGRLLGELLCESVGQINCYWQPKVELIPLFIYFFKLEC